MNKQTKKIKRIIDSFLQWQFLSKLLQIWVYVTPSDSSFTISPHNLVLLHSILLHSYPVPLMKKHIPYRPTKSLLPTFIVNTSSGILRVLGKKYIKRILTVNTMYYMKPQKANLKVMYL